MNNIIFFGHLLAKESVREQLFFFIANQEQIYSIVFFFKKNFKLGLPYLASPVFLCSPHPLSKMTVHHIHSGHLQLVRTPSSQATHILQ